MKDTLITVCPEETLTVGRRLGATLKPGNVVALMGELGSGKTCLAQGICAGLGVDEDVVSPTFTLVNEYHGRYPVSHLDLYRLDDADAVLALGYDEYVTGDRICLIEWADKFPALLPASAIVIQIEILDHERRSITVQRP